MRRERQGSLLWCQIGKHAGFSISLLCPFFILIYEQAIEPVSAYAWSEKKKDSVEFDLRII